MVDGEFTSAANDAKFGWLIGGLLNFNKYMYQNIFHHTLYIFQRPKWNKQCWLNPSRMSWASAGRRWLRFVIIFDDWGADHMNINVTQESVSCLDFKIFGRNNASVCCHSTILMLALPLMRHLLCDESCLILPDFSLEELKSFVKLLYGCGNRFIHYIV